MAQNVKQFIPNFLFFVNINVFLKSKKFGFHFNNILLGVKFVLLSLSTAEICQTNLLINVCQKFRFLLV
jgi:hypothetical protein